MTSPRPALVVSRRAWRRIHTDLAKRGQGRRESATFLLGRPDSVRVTAWVPYDDLDPTCLTGGISFSGARFADLWRLCSEHGVSVLADLHTHPGTSVEQSPIDQAKPTIARAGHISLITPSFARHTPSASHVGVHIYQGAGDWHSVPPAQRAAALHIRPLALWSTTPLRPVPVAAGHKRIGTAP